MNIYNLLKERNYIDCFPYQSSYDEFERNYDNKKLFVNPPFSKMDKVVEWIIKQVARNNLIILMIPARTDTKYFHKLLALMPNIFFIRGRLHYNEKAGAPFPTIILKFCGPYFHLPLYKAIEQEDIEKIL